MPNRLCSFLLAATAAAALTSCDANDANDGPSDLSLGTFSAIVNGQAFEPPVSGALIFESGASPLLFITGDTCANPLGTCGEQRQIVLMIGALSGKGHYALDALNENEGAYSVVRNDTFRTYASATTGEIVVTHYTKGKSVAGTFAFTDTDANCGGFAETCTATVTNGRFYLPITPLTSADAARVRTAPMRR